LEVGRCALVFAQALIEHELEYGKSKKKEADFTLKNYRPPHPIGVKGGCSPQNNREKLGGY
jgi:hypothetical protein